MGDMSPITAAVDNVSHTFQLLEADIPALTFHNASDNNTVVSNGADYISFAALASAIGVNRAGEPREVDAFFMPGVFYKLVDPKGNYVARPTGKAMLATAAQMLADAGHPWPDVVKATLAMALKGGGLTLTAAAGVADNLARSAQSSSGKLNYVQSILTPSILSAAAAA